VDLIVQPAAAAPILRAIEAAKRALISIFRLIPAGDRQDPRVAVARGVRWALIAIRTGTEKALELRLLEI
jgi:hypothetical protein